MPDSRRAIQRTARWYLLQCKASQEARAQEHLIRQGFDTFLPQIECEKVRRGKLCALVEPLFPGYLFIQLDMERDNWQPVRSTRGVLRIVGFNGVPLPVPAGLVEELQVGRNGNDAPSVLFKPGDRVRLTSGPFKELDAVFCAYDGESRAIILLNIMNTQQQLSVPLSNL